MKILNWDIETSPMLLADFSLFNKNNTSHKNIVQDWFIICAAWKWLDEKKPEGIKITDNKRRFKRDHTDDYIVVKKLHEVLSEADLIVGHNADAFDWKKFNTRVIKHGLPPIPKVRSVDTYKIARKEFKFSSNKLDYITQYLGLSGKKPTSDGLWLRAMNGDAEAIQEMFEYNLEDVVIGEQAYLKLRPFYTMHANLSTVNDHMDDHTTKCPKCNSDKLQKRGVSRTNAGVFQRYQCQSCNGWSRGRQNLSSKANTGKAPAQKYLHSQ